MQMNGCGKFLNKHSFVYSGDGLYECKYCSTYFLNIAWHMRQVLLDPKKFLYLDTFSGNPRFLKLRVGERV